MWRLTGLVALAIVATGCASGQEARVAARLVLGETLQYQRLIDRKIAAETAYYANRELSLNQAFDRMVDNAVRLNIAQQANQGAANLLSLERPLVSADITAIVVAALRDQQVAFEELSQKRQELRLLVTDSLVPLALDKAALQRTQKSLEQLQISPDEATRLKALYEFVKATRSQYDKLKKEDPKAAE